MTSAVFDREVLGAAIVPHGERDGRPTDPAGKLGADGVGSKEVDERHALGLGHVGETNGMAAIEIERLAARGGVGADDPVQRPVGFPNGENIDLYVPLVTLTRHPSPPPLDRAL